MVETLIVYTPQVAHEAAFGLPSAFLVLLLSPWSYYQNAVIVITIGHDKTRTSTASSRERKLQPELN